MLNERTVAFLAIVREALKNETAVKVSNAVREMNDADLARVLFKPVGGLNKDHNVNSLTAKGAKILEHHFRSWEIVLTKPLTGKQHLIIMRNCTMPYYIGAKRIVVFDREVGVLLKLSQGSNDYIEQMFPD